MAAFETVPCMACGNTSVLELTADETDRLNAGAMVQNALPDRDADFRELLISGTHSSCWDAMFGEE